MIRHHAFFETLGEIDEQDPSWRPVLAGLTVLRLVDAIANRARGAAVENATAESARAKASAIGEGDPSRAILLRIIDLLDDRPEVSADLGEVVMSYGRALDLEARWALAADVFGTIAQLFTDRRLPALVIDAHAALGAACRNLGEWERSHRAYAAAQHLADSAGDTSRSLTVQVGIAGTHMVQGNLPAADAELDQVMSEAQARGLQDIEALALHAQASVSHARGNYARAIQLAYRALELTTSGSARDRILADIAASNAGLGLRDPARDGSSIVAVTSPHQWVRWQATLNLMELAVAEGSESTFDEHRGQLEHAHLDPRLRAYFLFYSAIGARRFSRDGYDVLLRRAYEHAAANGLHQIAFEIEAELASIAAVPGALPGALPGLGDAGANARTAGDRTDPGVGPGDLGTGSGSDQGGDDKNDDRLDARHLSSGKG